MGNVKNNNARIDLELNVLKGNVIGQLKDVLKKLDAIQNASELDLKFKNIKGIKDLVDNLVNLDDAITKIQGDSKIAGKELSESMSKSASSAIEQIALMSGRTNEFVSQLQSIANLKSFDKAKKEIQALAESINANLGAIGSGYRVDINQLLNSGDINQVINALSADIMRFSSEWSTLGSSAVQTTDELSNKLKDVTIQSDKAANSINNMNNALSGEELEKAQKKLDNYTKTLKRFQESRKRYNGDSYKSPEKSGINAKNEEDEIRKLSNNLETNLETIKKAYEAYQQAKKEYDSIISSGNEQDVQKAQKEQNIAYSQFMNKLPDFMGLLGNAKLVEEWKGLGAVNLSDALNKSTGDIFKEAQVFAEQIDSFFDELEKVYKTNIQKLNNKINGEPVTVTPEVKIEPKQDSDSKKKIKQVIDESIPDKVKANVEVEPKITVDVTPKIQELEDQITNYRGLKPGRDKNKTRQEIVAAIAELEKLGLAFDQIKEKMSSSNKRTFTEKLSKEVEELKNKVPSTASEIEKLNQMLGEHFAEKNLSKQYEDIFKAVQDGVMNTEEAFNKIKEAQINIIEPETISAIDKLKAKIKELFGTNLNGNYEDIFVKVVAGTKSYDEALDEVIKKETKLRKLETESSERLLENSKEKTRQANANAASAELRARKTEKELSQIKQNQANATSGNISTSAATGTSAENTAKEKELTQELIALKEKLASIPTNPVDIAELEAAQKEVQRLQEKILRLETSVDDWKDSFYTLQNQLDYMVPESEIENYTSNDVVDEYRKQIEDLSAKVVELNNNLAETKSKLEQAHSGPTGIASGVDESSVTSAGVNTEITNFEKLKEKLIEIQTEIEKKTQAFNNENATVTSVISTELTELEKLRTKLSEIETAINNKTSAFTNEQSAVGNVVDAEVIKLDDLESKLNTIAEKANIKINIEDNVDTVAGSINKINSETEKNTDTLKKQNKTLEENIAFLKEQARTMTLDEWSHAKGEVFDIKKLVYKSGFKDINKNSFWREANYGKQVNYSPMSFEDAEKTIYKKIEDKILAGWFRNGDSGYKPKITDTILGDDTARNASMNMLWKRYQEFIGKNIDFFEFLTKEIPVYRGKNSEKIIDDDTFMSFTFDKDIAKKFGDAVIEQMIRPIDTLGGGIRNGEVEIMVPTELVDAFKNIPRNTAINYNDSNDENAQKILATSKLISDEAEKQLNVEQQTTNEVEKRKEAESQLEQSHTSEIVKPEANLIQQSSDNIDSSISSTLSNLDQTLGTLNSTLEAFGKKDDSAQTKLGIEGLDGVAQNVQGIYDILNKNQSDENTLANSVKSAVEELSNASKDIAEDAKLRNESNQKYKVASDRIATESGRKRILDNATSAYSDYSIPDKSSIKYSALSNGVVKFEAVLQDAEGKLYDFAATVDSQGVTAIQKLEENGAKSIAVQKKIAEQEKALAKAREESAAEQKKIAEQQSNEINKAEIKKIDAQLQDNKQRIDKLQAELESKQNESVANTSVVENNQTVDNQQADVEKAKSELQAKIAKIENENRELLALRDRYVENLTLSDEDKSSLSSILGDFDKSNLVSNIDNKLKQAQDAKIAELDSKLKQVDDEIAKLSTETENVDTSKYDSKIIDVRKDLINVKDEIVRVQNDIDKLEKESTEKNKAKQEKVSKIDTRQSEIGTEIKSLESKKVHNSWIDSTLDKIYSPSGSKQVSFMFDPTHPDSLDDTSLKNYQKMDEELQKIGYHLGEVKKDLLEGMPVQWLADIVPNSEKVVTNLEEARDILTEPERQQNAPIDNQIEALKKESAALAEEKKQLLTSENNDENSSELKQLREELDNLNKEKERLNEEKKKLIEEKSKATNDSEQLTNLKQQKEELNTQKNDIINQQNAAVNQELLYEVQDKLNENNKKITELQSKINAEDTKASSKNTENSSSPNQSVGRSDSKDVDTAKQDLEKQIADIEKENQELKERRKQLVEAMANVSDENAQANNKISLDSISGVLKETKKQYESFSGANEVPDTLKGNYTNLLKTIEEVRNASRTYSQDEINNIENTCRGIQQEIEELQKKKSILSEQQSLYKKYNIDTSGLFDSGKKGNIVGSGYEDKVKDIIKKIQDEISKLNQTDNGNIKILDADALEQSKAKLKELNSELQDTVKEAQNAAKGSFAKAYEKQFGALNAALKNFKQETSGLTLDNNIANTVTKYEDALKKLNELKIKLEQAPKGSDTSDLVYQWQNVYKEAQGYQKELEKIVNTSKSIEDGISIFNINKDVDVNDIEQVRASLDKYINSLTHGKATVEPFDYVNNKLTATFVDEDGMIKKVVLSYDQLNHVVEQTTTTVKKATTGWDKLASTISVKFRDMASYFATFFSTYQIIGAVKQGVGYVKEIDAALTELKKVTDETDESYQRFLQSMSKTAGTVGSTVSDLVSSSADWARLNI